MLGSALAATATLQTTTSSATPTSPTRPSRLRGLSYLRSYTHNHLHSGSSSSSTRVEPPSLPRSVSAQEIESGGGGAISPRVREEASSIQSAENGWLPTVQGRSGLSRDSLHPTSSTESASPERSYTSHMTRSRTASGHLGPTPASRAALRRQSDAANGVSDANNNQESTVTFDTPQEHSATPARAASMPTIRFIPHLEARSSGRPSLNFTALARTLSQHNSIVRVGRYSERDQQGTLTSPQSLTNTSIAPVGFKSKVVSRRHCEFWCTNGQWYVKDVKSSSGTFLNHVRLSAPNVESRPYPVNDGDVVQLGIDFKGGEEVIFRCVKIRIECNRGWQKGLNSFNTTAHKRILKSAGVKTKHSAGRDSDAASTTGSSECSICLNAIAPCQALFVAPCSHVWHFKCVKQIIQSANYPNFLCPNCRLVTDLEADVEQPEDYTVDDMGPEEEEDDEETGEDVGGSNGGVGDDEDEDDDVALARLLGTTSLQINPTSNNHSGSTDSSGANHPLPSENSSEILNTMSNTSRPIHIFPAASRIDADRERQRNRRPSSSDLLGARATTPTSTTPFALATGMMTMGMMDLNTSTERFFQEGMGMGNGGFSMSVGRDVEGEGEGEGENENERDGAGPLTPRNDAGPFCS